MFARGAARRVLSQAHHLREWAQGAASSGHCARELHVVSKATGSRYAAIVVGCGGTGSAALAHAARRGAAHDLPVLGLELQPSVAHDRGSSHGESRIIRTAYMEGAAYVPLVRHAYRLWEQLERDTGMRLLVQTGGLDIGGCAEDAALSCRTHGLEHETLSGGEVADRFPGYEIPHGMPATFQADAGILAPEVCISAHVRVAEEWGAQLRTDERVTGWEVRSSDGLVAVRTSAAEYLTERLILTPGAWMSKLVPEMTHLVVPERQVVGWFDIPEQHSDKFSPGTFPIFIIKDGGDYWYGFPDFGVTRGLKLGKYNHLKQTCDPDALDREISLEDKTVFEDVVRKFFPLVSGHMRSASTCMFTNTPDAHFILDHHPRHKQVVLGAACSGHGFKFAPALGEILVGLAFDGTTKHDIRLHRIHDSRPGHSEFLRACHAA